MEIQPQFGSLNKLVAGRLFKIPKYQRAYSWGPKQRRDLFHDIDNLELKGHNHSHFMATIVGLRRGQPSAVGTDEFVEIEVVDGQQRLTTLTLLLKAISKKLDASISSENKAKTEIEGLLVKEDDVSLLLLQTNHDTSHIFTTYIRHGTLPAAALIKTDADKNLAEAIIDCESFAGKWKAGKKLLGLYSLLKNKLFFIFHEVSDEALVYTVFEVLNSRGLDVVWFDKLKSLLMGLVFEHAQETTAKTTIRELHNTWGDIYQTIGLKRGLSSEALRFCGTLHSQVEQSKPISEEAAVELLVRGCGTKPSSVIQTTKWLLETVEAENRLEENIRLSAATRILQARLVAVAIMLRGFSKQEEENCLSEWEKVTFKIFGLADKDSRSKVGDYVRLAWKISNAGLSVKAIMAALKELGKEFKLEELIRPGSYRNFYQDWGEELRYLLYRYEEYLACEAGQKINQSQWNKIWAAEPASSIEHILPQSKGFPAIAKSNIYVHALGNLTMLPPGLNSSFGAKDPKQKADRYVSSGLMDTAAVGELLKRNAWDLKAMQEREKTLIDWIYKEWA